MDSWVTQVNKRARILIDQIVAARTAARVAEQDLGWLESQYSTLLEQLYASEYAAARLRDNSDLVVRAEGPGADEQGPSLRSFKWLSDHVLGELTRLSSAVIPLAVSDAKAVSKKLGWVFTGYAPGSIMMGFALKEPSPQPGFEQADAIAFDTVRQAAQAVATVPQFVRDQDLDPRLADQIQDPALRDTAIIAAWRFSPTAQSGIHTVEVASRTGDFGSLSQRERMVLKKSIESPLFRKTERGSFVGRMRAADLDKYRLILRDVEGVGSIRCAVSQELISETQRLFGGYVKVTGKYEADRTGRPRMMRIERIEGTREPRQLPLSR